MANSREDCIKTKTLFVFVFRFLSSSAMAVWGIVQWCSTTESVIRSASMKRVMIQQLSERLLCSEITVTFRQGKCLMISAMHCSWTVMLLPIWIIGRVYDAVGAKEMKVMAFVVLSISVASSTWDDVRVPMIAWTFLLLTRFRTANEFWSVSTSVAQLVLGLVCGLTEEHGPNWGKKAMFKPSFCYIKSSSGLFRASIKKEASSCSTQLSLFIYLFSLLFNL